MNNIPRPIYIKRIQPYIGKSIIKVLVGQRRVGKSFILMQIRDILMKENPDIQIIYINKEQREYQFIRTSDDLSNYVKENTKHNKKTALFIDEIQDIDHFELALRDLATNDQFDIYCTGSNANLLSGELATYLSGRYIEIKIFALSYPEFLQFHRLEDSDVSFRTYLTIGGMPYLTHLGTDKLIAMEYLKNIFNSIILKDVVSRFNIRNVQFLENLVLFLSDNLGSIVSAKKISDYLKSQRINISVQTVIDYLAYLETSLMLFKVKRAGIKGKKIFEIGEKYYFEDIGIRNAINGFNITDVGDVLENIVYLHLRIADYSVNVGYDGVKEIDFIADKYDERIYIQVTYLLSDQKTIDREFGNLLSIKDNYPKYVISMDSFNNTNNYKGIIHQNTRNFCKQILGLK